MAVTLDEILASTRRSLTALRAGRPRLERALRNAPVPPRLEPALRCDAIAVIAEVKRRSLSAGTIRADLDPAERAALYAAHGAAAVSVLTEGRYFGGSVADLRAAAERVRVPILRKDFILDEVQVLEARVAGASAVLLIVRALAAPRLEALLGCATALGLDALVEVHTAPELETALEAGARIVGVNSRDLDTFRINTAAAWDLLTRVPADRVAVAESGMRSAADVEQAGAAGADAVLIGTALSAATRPEQLLEAACRVPRHGR